MAYCLVTGGAGFIGSHLAGALVEAGHRVRVLDNFSTGNRENLSGYSDKTDVIEGDIRDQQAVANAMTAIELVFHQAALVSVPYSIEDPETCYQINVQGTMNILDAARKAGVSKVVLASSAAVYGNSQALPLGENQSLHPLSPYALSKQVNELYAILYSQVFDLDTVALRYFNVYGPRQSPDSDYASVIPLFVNALIERRQPTVFGDGNQSRDFIYVEDVVRANLLAAASPDATGLSINICTGQGTTLNQLLATMAEILQYQPNPHYTSPRPGDIYRSLGDPDRATHHMNFTAQVSLVEGLRETVEWMRS